MNTFTVIFLGFFSTSVKQLHSQTAFYFQERFGKPSMASSVFVTKIFFLIRPPIINLSFIVFCAHLEIKSNNYALSLTIFKCSTRNQNKKITLMLYYNIIICGIFKKLKNNHIITTLHINFFGIK